MADPYGLKSQVQSGLSRQFKKFVGGALENISGGGTSLSQVSRLQNNPKRSTEHLEFPLGVANGDPGIGNHGHYIMFYINTQTKAKLRTSGEAGGGSIVDSDREYNIPKFIQEWNSVTQSYEKVKGEAIKAKNVNDALLKASTDPQAIRQGTAPIVSQDVQSKASGSTIRIKRAPTKRLKTGIAMYMPAQVQVAYKAEYTDTPIGNLTEGAMGAYAAAVQGNYRGATESVLNLDQDLSNMLKEFSLGAVGVLPGMAGAKEAFEMKEGVVISDRLELAFKKVEKRSFNYSFKMTPKNKAEADEIRKIIFAFKSNMMPEFLGGNRSGRRMIVPNTFDIQYMYCGQSNNYLHNISTCVLNDLQVSYGGERYKTFDAEADGAPPVETSISLSFTEMELITRERIFEGY